VSGVEVADILGSKRKQPKILMLKRGLKLLKLDFIKEKIRMVFLLIESTILFGIPANMIEGVLVGREYERDNNKLSEIKSLLPNCFICNLEGKVIR